MDHAVISYLVYFYKSVRVISNLQMILLYNTWKTKSLEDIKKTRAELYSSLR